MSSTVPIGATTADCRCGGVDDLQQMKLWPKKLSHPGFRINLRVLC